MKFWMQKVIYEIYLAMPLHQAVCHGEVPAIDISSVVDYGPQQDLHVNHQRPSTNAYTMQACKKCSGVLSQLPYSVSKCGSLIRVDTFILIMLQYIAKYLTSHGSTYITIKIYTIQ